ncbi:MAG: SUMF1/EgtB/PvdO family nonheme iron enzyme, partial [Opitutaceae bacterium]|nr:SUMF1/EgtB/PvdO family nonheme iron enzyme [Opitutaceae bacterium]
MHPDDPKGSCCAPGRAHDGANASDPLAFRRVSTGSTDGMKLIPSGDFLMGTNGDYGFASDGEGPAHTVKLDPFWMDATTVTNEQFNTFVNATGYKTESEKFGWSFVFYGHLTPMQQAATQRVRVLGSEWWCRVDGAIWRHPEGPGSNIKKRWSHPVVQVSWHDATAYAAWA